MNEPRKTVGRIQTELAPKSIDDNHSAYEQSLEQLSEYEQNLIDRIEAGKKEYAGDFYIVVITKRERLMDKVLRHYFLARSTCPTPQYDEAVYKYHKKEDRVEFLWVVPDKSTCEDFMMNAVTTSEDEKVLRDFVIKFKSGDLDLVAMKMNGEIIL